MSKEIKNKMVPILRFPEFQNSKEWEVKELNKIATKVIEKAGVKRYVLMSVTAGVGLVSQMEKFGREIAGNAYKNYFVINKGDFAYNKSSTKQHPEGQIAILENSNQGAVPNSIFTCFRINENLIFPYFLKYPFNNNIHGNWLRKFIAIGARANGALNVDDKYLFALPIVYPSLKEQQKIADCLSFLDELITAQSQKLLAIKDRKKGLMQQLFPAEGETEPELRFTEFMDSGEWEENTLGEIAKVTTGNKDTQNKVDDGLFPFFVRSQTVERINSYSFDGEAILTSGDGVGVGKNFHYIKGKFDFHQRVYSIYDFSKQIKGLFLFQYFSEHFNKRVMKMSAKNSVDSVRMAMITEMPIWLPSLNEQQKIADCLSSLDELIKAQTEKIEQLKVHKKGLMQQLFPVVGN